MKLHKSTLITVAVMLTLATNVRAQFAGTTTQFSKLNIALTVSTTGDSMEKGNSIVTSINKTKLDNKTLLDLFAQWSGNNPADWQAAGAQWIYDWDTVQPAIADRSGTNILLYVGPDNAVVNGTQTSSFDIQWWGFDNNGFGPFSRTFQTTDPGSDNFTDNFDLGYMRLLHTDSGDSTANIDLGANGPKVEHYTQTWDGAHTFLHWTDTETFKPAGAGEIFQGESEAAVSGVITAHGSGSGRNTYIYNP